MYTGLYHQTIMPCRLSIWREKDQYFISVSNPEVFFAVFFLDALPNMSPRLVDLFKIFPTFVLNEIITLVNGGLKDLGVEERMPLKL